MGGEPDWRLGLPSGRFGYCRERGGAEAIRVAFAPRRHGDDPARGDFTQAVRLTASLDCGGRAFISCDQNRSGLGIKASAASGERKHLTHGGTDLRTRWLASRPATGAKRQYLKYAAA
jgi:hypothetical protein